MILTKVAVQWLSAQARRTRGFNELCETALEQHAEIENSKAQLEVAEEIIGLSKETYKELTHRNNLPKPFMEAWEKNGSKGWVVAWWQVLGLFNKINETNNAIAEYEKTKC